MKLLITRSAGSNSLYTFDSVSRTKGTFGKVHKDCTVVLNGASIVHYLELTQTQHNKFIEKVFAGDENFKVSYDNDNNMTFDGIPAVVVPQLSIVGNSSVSFEQGSSANLTVEFTGECVDFTPKTIWVVESGNITINKTSETTATVSASNQTSGVIAVTMPTNARTVQTVRYNITVNPLTPPNIAIVGSNIITMEKGETSDITVSLTGGSDSYVSDVQYSSDSADVTVEKLTKTTARITGLNIGSGNVTATVVGTNKKVTYSVVVNPLTPPTISAVGNTTLTMPMGSTNNIEVKLTGGSSGYNADVEYTSDNASVTVEKLTKTTAKLTGVSDGSATVTAKVIGTNNKVTYSVSVSAEIPV